MATPNIVPRNDSEGGLGTTSKYWGSAYIDTITTTGNVTVGGTLQAQGDTAVNFNLYRSGTGQLWNFGIDSSGRLQLKEAASLGGTKVLRFQIDDDGDADFFGDVTVTPGNISFDLSGQATGTTVIGNNSGSSAAPTVGGKTSATNGAGLQIISGSHDTNSGPDMFFSAREHDNSDFSTLTTTAFEFKRFTTPLVSILRNGKVGIGTTAPETKLHVLSNNNISKWFRKYNFFCTNITKWSI